MDLYAPYSDAESVDSEDDFIDDSDDEEERISGTDEPSRSAADTDERNRVGEPDAVGSSQPHTEAKDHELPTNEYSANESTTGNESTTNASRANGSPANASQTPQCHTAIWPARRSFVHDSNATSFYRNSSLMVPDLSETMSKIMSELSLDFIHQKPKMCSNVSRPKDVGSRNLESFAGSSSDPLGIQASSSAKPSAGDTTSQQTHQVTTSATQNSPQALTEGSVSDHDDTGFQSNSDTLSSSFEDLDPEACENGIRTRARGPRRQSASAKPRQARSSPKSNPSRSNATDNSSPDDSCNDNDCGDDDGQPPNQKQQTSTLIGKKYACPFYKHDSTKYQNCQKVGYTEPHRIKSHVRRVHIKSEKCDVCGCGFGYKSDLDNHNCGSNTASGINSQQGIDITNNNAFQAVLERRVSWVQLYCLLFSCAEKDCPDPYHPDGFETSSDNESGFSHVNFQSPKSSRNHDDVQDRVAFMSQKLAPIFQEMVSRCLSPMIRDMVLQFLAPKLQSMLEQHLPSILIEYETMGQASSTSASTPFSTESIIDNPHVQDNLMGQSQELNLGAEPFAVIPYFEGQDGRPFEVVETGLPSWTGNEVDISGFDNVYYGGWPPYQNGPQ